MVETNELEVMLKATEMGRMIGVEEVVKNW